MPVPLCLLREAGSDDDAEGWVRGDETADDGAGEGLMVMAECEEAVEVGRGDGEEETAGGLGVGGDEAEGVGGVREVGPWGGEFGIGFGAAGEAAGDGEVGDGWVEEREGGGVDFSGDAALAAERAEVAEEAEACDVGAGADETEVGGVGAGEVEGLHAEDGAVAEGVGADAAFDGGGGDAGAERFGEDEQVAGQGAGVGDDAVRVDEAGDAEAVDWFREADGVAAGEDAVGFEDFFCAAAEDGGDDGEVEVVWHADDVHGCQGAAAHGVDIGETVGGGDAAVG